MTELVRRLGRAAALSLCALLGACATAAFDEAQTRYRAGDPVGAVALLDQAAERDQIPARDTLLLHLERGLMLHRAGDYERSAQAFVEADRLIEASETISLSGQATALLSNDWSQAYPGEYSERLWSHSYAMMSFLMAGRAQGAAVEARRALKVLEAYPEALSGAHFSRALIGLSFEMAGQYNDAYVAYRALHRQLPESRALALATYRAARAVASSDGVAEWRDRVPAPLWQAYANSGPEAVLLLSAGRAPVKISSSLVYYDERLSFPAYLPNNHRFAELQIRDGQGVAQPFERVSTDTYAVSVAALDRRGAKMLAKAALRGKIKHELVDDLADRDETAAQVLNLVFFLLEEADTRSWQSLPARLTLARVPLRPGQSELQVQLGGERRTLSLDPQAGARPQLFSLHFP